MASTLVDLLPILAQLSEARDQRVSLAELAEQAGKSPSHFQRTFARIVGESPKQYTLRLQLECAAVLLLSSSDTVLDVALAAGFESHEGFTRAFVRQFGRPPKEFRAHAVASGLTAQLQHMQLITHLGPCLRLFRAPLRNPSQKERTMSYDITQQPIEEMTVLYKSARVEQAKIADALGQILPSVFQYATQAGIAMMGPPMTRYVEWGPGMVTLEAGLAVAPGSKGKDDIEVTVLPAGNAAVTIHTGSYDGLGDAHAAVEQYLHEHALKASGPPIEIYLTDPGEVPNPDDWKTRIVWPVEG